MTLLCTPQFGDLSEVDHGSHKTLYDSQGRLCYIDVDWKAPLVPGAPTLISYHNFQETPKNLHEILAQMKRRPAAFYKIATLANSTLDACRMLEFVRAHSNVIGLCMGQLGEMTRILAPCFGTPIMYAPLTLETQTAPGQLPFHDLVSTYRFRKLNTSTALYGLIGDPVSHSIGHEFHNQFFDQKGINAVYVKMRVHSEELAAFLGAAKNLNFKGLSVTMPLKEKILPFLDQIDPVAQAIGAVNTVVFQKGKMIGYNTDAEAARIALETLGPLDSQKVAILGRGGAAKAIAFALEKAGASVATFTRALEEFASDYTILINATPSPMPLDPSLIIPGKKIMDLSLLETPFLHKARKKGCSCLSGYPMYLHQALQQQFLWGN